MYLGKSDEHYFVAFTRANLDMLASLSDLALATEYVTKVILKVMVFPEWLPSSTRVVNHFLFANTLL